MRSNLVDHLLILRESLGLQLGEDQLPVQLHLEASPIGWDQLQRAEPLPKGIHNGFGQAHGLWDVVSSDTVFELDIERHHSLPPLKNAQP